MVLSSTMYAIQCLETGKPEDMIWVKHPMPSVANDEVLVQVAAAGVNRADCLQRQGRYPPPEGASSIVGLEISGRIVAVGEAVTSWRIGDDICALLSGGGYAEYVAVPQGQCLPKPPHMSWAEAAVLPECLATVWSNVFEIGDLKPNEIALIHGGTSGIGTMAIQMIKLFGAQVFVTARSDEKCAACDALGANLSINYKVHDFVSVIEHATKGRGVNVVLDMVGGDYVNRNLLVLAPLGRHVSIAFLQGRHATLDMRAIIQKRLTVTGSTLRARTKAEKAKLVASVTEKVWPWVVQGHLKPLIYNVWPIKNALEAHKVMESGQHIGKMALEVLPAL